MHRYQRRLKRRIAEQFQAVMRAGLEGLRDRLPAGEVIITEKDIRRRFNDP